MTDLRVVPLLDREALGCSSSLSAEAFRSRGARSAIVAGERVLSHGDLGDLIDQRRLELGATPQLVVLHGSTTVDFVVTYLAALDGGHPVIVAAGADAATEICTRFEATVSVDASDHEDLRIERFESAGTRGWHPELAAMMSTSGSTGSPKLVRLSREAVTSNAEAIASSLDLDGDDRAITSLPLHYCYGLSVVTSHLVVGASVVLTDTAVVDPCFWSAVADHGVTTLAGVPHTFDMIDRLRSEVLAAPSLRRLTQAGGRMDPSMVERFAAAGRYHGWDFVVMYGQTEATSRMACMLPDRALTHPASVGVAIPGGSIRIDPVPGAPAGVGEVVYEGPNVMMGYATSAADLDRGLDLVELRTGDLGRLDAVGNLEIVGRLSRFVKLHGKRIDLDHLEAQLDARHGCERRLHVTGDDDGLVVATFDTAGQRPSLDDLLQTEVADLADVPPGRVLGVRVKECPRTESGKVDGPALVGLARELARSSGGAGGRRTKESVADAFATVFGRRPDPGESFASLGGDSFSYVEMSIRLESVLRELPSDWHLMPVAELESRPPVSATRWRHWTRSVDTSVAIRAIGILLIVCTHMGIFRVAGGAHALLAVVGFNVARFQLLPSDIVGRAARSVATIARVAVPASVWIGLNMLLGGGYSLGALLLVNNYTGSAHRAGGRWEYWYFEAFVQIVIVIAVVFSVRSIRRAEQARPFAFALGVLGLTWLVRFEIVNLGGAYNEIFRSHTVACFVALGWCAQRATTLGQRLIVSVLAAVTVLGYFETVGRVDQLDRELRILAMVLALVWLRSVRLPTPVALIVGKVAAASMWIFLVHWQVWPLFTPWLDDRMAFLATIGTGVAVWWLVGRASAGVVKWRQRRFEGRSTSNHVSNAETVINSNDVTPVSA